MTLASQVIDLVRATILDQPSNSLSIGKLNLVQCQLVLFARIGNQIDQPTYTRVLVTLTNNPVKLDYPRANKSSARKLPSWPLIPVIRSRFFFQSNSPED